MDSGYYPFRLGQFDCASLLDGFMDYPPQNIYANASREQVEAALRQHNLPVEVVTTPYTYLYVNTRQHRLLVDMGAGELTPKTGRLIYSMRSAGITPAEIDSVIISHAHPDHIGGMLDDQGRPIYPNARYYIGKEEWAFWFSEGAGMKANEHFISMTRKALALVKDRVVLVDQESEILTGVRAILAPGHTPGHLVVLVHSDDQALICIGDTVLQPLHLEYPDWLSIYDIQPEKAVVSKQRVFNLAADEHYLVHGVHFPPFPSIGTVSKHGKGWLWTPALPG
jgi:glyoxylase-like metal-dependent hydrolase (beta-lactamase superfamily II)